MSEISREVIPFEKGGIRCHLHGGKVPGKRRYLWENQLLSFFLENALKSLKLGRVARLLLANRPFRNSSGNWGELGRVSNFN